MGMLQLLRLSHIKSPSALIVRRTPARTACADPDLLGARADAHTKSR